MKRRKKLLDNEVMIYGRIYRYIINDIIDIEVKIGTSAQDTINNYEPVIKKLLRK